MLTCKPFANLSRSEWDLDNSMMLPICVLNRYGSTNDEPSLSSHNSVASLNARQWWSELWSLVKPVRTIYQSSRNIEGCYEFMIGSWSLVQHRRVKIFGKLVFQFMPFSIFHAGETGDFFFSVQTSPLIDRVTRVSIPLWWISAIFLLTIK